MSQDVVMGVQYRHFKGGTYTTMTLSTDEATGEPYVVYLCHSDNKVYHRKVNVFTSLVDGVKYPEHAGEKRFTLIKQSIIQAGFYQPIFL